LKFFLIFKIFEPIALLFFFSNFGHLFSKNHILVYTCTFLMVSAIALHGLDRYWWLALYIYSLKSYQIFWAYINWRTSLQIVRNWWPGLGLGLAGHWTKFLSSGKSRQTFMAYRAAEAEEIIFILTSNHIRESWSLL
jgi:hypothetical protein